MESSKSMVKCGKRCVSWWVDFLDFKNNELLSLGCEQRGPSISPPPYTWRCLDIFSKWVVSRKASLDPSGFLPVKNESQTVLTVSLSPDDEAPLTRAILCSPCEEHEEQKRQFDLHLVRLILTQLRCIGSVCAHGTRMEALWRSRGDFRKAEQGTHEKNGLLDWKDLQSHSLFLQREETAVNLGLMTQTQPTGNAVTSIT